MSDTLPVIEFARKIERKYQVTVITKEDTTNAALIVDEDKFYPVGDMILR